MNLQREKNRKIAAVFAHPDDEAFTMAGTIAKYSNQNVQIILICATSGQAGTKVHIKKGQDLAKVREEELRACCSQLKVKKLHLLGFVDGKLNQVKKDELEAKISTILSNYDPDIVITFGPEGVSGHVDHVAIGNATTNVFNKLYKNKNKRLLYVAPLEREDLKIETGLGPELSATKAKYLHLKKTEEVDVMVDINNVWEFKLKAMHCHFSQDDARNFYTKLKKQPLHLEAFCLCAGTSFKRRPASDLFEDFT